MAIGQTTTTSFRVELFEAVHNFNTDTFKIALYTGAADIGPDTTVYTTSGEASGTGYTAGGETLTVSTTPTSANNTQGIPTAYVSFSNVSWTSASFTARGALIYNSTQGNKSVAVLDFGADKTVTDQTFTVQFPTADANSAIVRIA
jgi:hypothetical protein